MNIMAGRGDHRLLEGVVDTVGTVLLGKKHQIRLALCCLLARGHLLIEDLPGMGKTTLAHGLAISLGLTFKRIQFTSDLLPSDILGISVYERATESFRYHPGPVFTQLLLADEINRTTPKTQSALLEAMAEGQVTIEGETRPLPSPFFVIATQNPVSQSGTYPLPESQQDRFTMRISLGYPDPLAEKKMLLGGGMRDALSSLNAALGSDDLLRIQRNVGEIHVSDAVADYLLRLVRFTRDNRGEIGLSPRASLAVLQCARAWALMEGRDYVVPEDIQAVFPAVAEHRLAGLGETASAGALVEQAVSSVDIL